MTMTRKTAGAKFGMGSPQQVVPQGGAGGQSVGDGNPYAATPAPVGPGRPTFEKSTKVPVSKKPAESNTASQKFVDADPRSKHKFD